MKRHASWVAAVALGVAWLTWVGRSSNDLPAGTIRLADGADHWARRGFFELTPTVQPPVGRARGTVVRIFAYVPLGRRISAATIDGRALPQAPAGAIFDRVEYRDSAHGEVIADVRGTRFLANGREEFHVFRPLASTSNAVLFGTTWRRDDPRGTERAAAVMRPALARGLGFVEPERVRSVDRFVRLLECASCHGYARAEDAAREHALRRGTDASGLFSLRYALSDQAPLESYLPIDPNHGRRFYRYLCGDGRVASDGTTRPRCAKGEAPRVVYDLPSALVAGDPHARRVCEGRLALARHFDARAHAAFASAIEPCRTALR